MPRPLLFSALADWPRTETKAITVFPVWELLALMPTLLHPFVRESRYYTASNDSLTFHAQTTRSRTANQEENRRKLMDEITRIYRENTPNETSEEKKNKYQEMYVVLVPGDCPTRTD